MSEVNSVAAIIDSINDNDVDKFCDLLNNLSFNLDSIIDSKGQTLMHYAILGSVKFIEELLDRGADPDSMDSDEWTPLLVAAKAGKAEACEELLKRGAQIDHKDMSGWTALMWACYKGWQDVVKILLKYGAETQLREEHGMAPIMWAAGRGYATIVKDLLNAGAKAQSIDKFNSSALLWACRKGYKDCAEHLLNAGAAIDTVGMNGWTPLLAACHAGALKLVKLLFNYNPNLNHRDKDGMTAVALAAQAGFEDIVMALLLKGANGALPNLLNDTPLILAARNGHYGVVKVLLNNNLGTNAQGHRGKTALYHSVEKNYNDIIMLLLRNKCDTEIRTEDGETALHRAIHNRNTVAVQLLLEAGADVAKPDKKGDTALHLSVRMRSKHLTEMLLRNPKHSKILYIPNHTGQTPYNIDAQSAHPFLPYLFGAQHLKSYDYTENMLGYDLYSSALADVLCDPMLGLPLTVGLYAKWGSGKSFLLKKLQDEMKSFTDHELAPTFTISVFVSAITVVFALFPSLFVSLTVAWEYGIYVFLGLLVIFYTFYGLLAVATYFEWKRFMPISEYIAIKFNKLKLLFQIIYCNPYTTVTRDLMPQGVRFLFTDYMKLTIMGGEISIAGMIATLCDAAENEFGLLTVRFFRVFHPKINDKRRTKTCLFIPRYFVTIAIGLCLTALVAIIFKAFVIDGTPPSSSAIPTGSLQFKAMVGLGAVILLACIANLGVWKRLAQYSFRSQAHIVLHSADNLEGNKAEGFMQKIKGEVTHLVDMVQSIDLFTKRHTRLVVIVDGLDSCEQDKVLQILEAVKTLFSDSKAPFITILAIDPHIIIRAIESNLNSAFQKSAIKGYEYLRNAVNLPIFLQRQGLLQFCAGKNNPDQRFKNIIKKHNLMYSSNLGLSATSIKGLGKSSYRTLLQHPQPFNGSIKLNGPRASFTESIASNSGDKSLQNHPHGASSNAFKGSSMFGLSNMENMDFQKIFTNDHYFSDINPRSLRRLTNIVYVAGRLMKAFSIDFQWVRLATWVNMIEQWPYRSSWIILYYEENEHYLDSKLSLKHIYESISPLIPTSREIEPFLEFDKNDMKLIYMLSGSNIKLTVADVKLFLPFSVNLDPYIKKVIREHIGDLLKCKSPSGLQQNLNTNTQQLPMTAGIKPLDYYLSGKISPTIPAPPHQSIEDQLTPKTPNVFVEEDFSELASTTPYNEILKQKEPLLRSPQLGTVSAEQQAIISSLFQNLKISKPVTQLTSTDIADLLIQIPDWGPQKNVTLESYQKTIIKNNINGFVLLTCDKRELQNILRMNFGDWHVFLGFILYLRYLSNVAMHKKFEDEDSANKLSLQQTAINNSGNKLSHVMLPERFMNMGMSHLEKEVEQEHEILSAAISKFEENDARMSESDVDDEYQLEAGTTPQTVTFPPTPEMTAKHPKTSYHKFSSGVNRSGLKKTILVPSEASIVEGDEIITHPHSKKKSNARSESQMGNTVVDFNALHSPPQSENFPLLNYEQKPSEEDPSLDPIDIHFKPKCKAEIVSPSTPLHSVNEDRSNKRTGSVISSQLKTVHDILQATLNRHDSGISKRLDDSNSRSGDATMPPKNFIISSVPEESNIGRTQFASITPFSSSRHSSKKPSRQPSVQDINEAEQELKEREEALKRRIEINEERPDYASRDYCPHSVMRLERKSSRIKQDLDRIRKNSIGSQFPTVIRDFLGGGSSLGPAIQLNSDLSEVPPQTVSQPSKLEDIPEGLCARRPTGLPASTLTTTASSSSSSSSSMSSTRNIILGSAQGNNEGTPAPNTENTLNNHINLENDGAASPSLNNFNNVPFSSDTKNLILPTNTSPKTS